MRHTTSDRNPLSETERNKSGGSGESQPKSGASQTKENTTSYSALEAFDATFKLSQRDILQYFDTSASWDSTAVDPTSPWDNSPKNTKSQRRHRLRTSERTDKNHDLLHTASAKTPTAPRTTRTRPTTPSRWRPDLSLTLPNPSINNPFQNTPSPYLSRPSQRSSPSPWPTTTKKPEAVQTEARVRSWNAPRLLAIEEGMPPRRPPTPTPDANDLGPRVMDYAAGRPGALHHSPQPFDTEPLRQWDLPHIPSTETPKRNLPFLGFAPPRCYFCRDLRHAEKDCLEPHQHCKRDRRCVVPRRHPHFEQLCPFGAERGRWQTTAGRLRHTVSRYDMPPPELQDILAEDGFDADSDYDRKGGKRADRSPSPQGPVYPKNSLLLNSDTPLDTEEQSPGSQDTHDFLQKCGTASTTQLTKYYDDSELRTIDLQSPTPTSTPDNPSTEIQKDLYDPAWSGPDSPRSGA